MVGHVEISSSSFFRNFIVYLQQLLFSMPKRYCSIQRGTVAIPLVNREATT
jgi:hypothetical protein